MSNTGQFKKPSFDRKIHYILRGIKDFRKNLIQINIRKKFIYIKFLGIEIINTYVKEIKPLFSRKELKKLMKQTLKNK